MQGAGSRVAAIVMGHHERLDGFGYPQGAKGAALPLASQILATAEMLMGLAESGPSAAEQAPFAVRLVPGEFGPLIIDRVQQAAQAARGQSDAAAAPDRDTLGGAIEALTASIHRVRELRARVVAHRTRLGKVAGALLTHGFERWDRIGIALSSTGLDLGGRALIAQLGDPELREVDFVRRELTWRITELGRQLLMRADDFTPSDLQPIQALIDAGRRPVANAADSVAA